jgi:acyl-CoA thioester hydrolase
MNDAATLPFRPGPFDSGEGEVLPGWIDSNDHMNLAYYIVLFDQGTDGIYDAFGMDRGYKKRSGCGTFAAESHTIYENELLLGDRVRMTTWVVAADAKRLHLAHEMHRISDGRRAAMQELMFLHIDLSVRRVAPWPAEVLARMLEAKAAQGAPPAWVGRRVGQGRVAG